ncbi:MAG: tyrosine-type recombinase/integrase [Sphingomonas sp.]
MLTDIQCRNAKAKERAYKLAAGGGLYLMVTTSGFRSWRMKYRYARKEKQLTFGGYPEVSLVQARDLRDAARKQLRAGIDPSVHKKQQAAAAALSAETTFRTVALAWHEAQARLWKPRYAEQVLQRFENDVFSAIGSIPIGDVTAAMILMIVRAIEAREAIEMAHRVRQHISDVFVFAIASGWAEDDPAHVIRKALVKTSPRLRPAVTKLAAARKVLAKTEQLRAYIGTKLAGRLLALTAARPGVVRLAAPEEFEGLDTTNPLWRIPAAKMKLTRERQIDVTYEFVIPLSRQAVDVVKAALSIVGPTAPLLFPSVRNAHAPMSDSTLSKLYRDAGFRGVHVPHGWRATFSTIMNELAAELDRDEDRAIIDMMLAHIQNGVEPAYNRAAYMKRRRAIAQQWADRLMVGAAPAMSLVEERRGLSPRNLRRRNHERRVAEAGDPRSHQGVQRPADRPRARSRSARAAAQL